MSLRTVVPVVSALALYSAVAGAANNEAAEEDSVERWGRWEQMVAPAAGPGVETNPAQMVAQEAVQNLRPEDSEAYSRQFAGLGFDGPVDPPIQPPIDPPIDPPTRPDVPDVGPLIPDQPVIITQPTPAPPPPPLPVVTPPDVAPPVGGGVPVVTQPTPAPPPPLAGDL